MRPGRVNSVGIAPSVQGRSLLNECRPDTQEHVVFGCVFDYLGIHGFAA